MAPMNGAALSFAGFGGLSLAAEGFGSPDHPAVVLLHGGAQSRGVWRVAARALAAAGRYAITVDLRGHGQSDWATDGRYDLEAFAEDLRAILVQLQKRPVVVGASLGGYVALAALQGSGAALASGLVLVDAALSMNPSGRERFGDILRRHALGFANLDEAAWAADELSPRRWSDPIELERHLRRGDSGRYFWTWDPHFPEGFGALPFPDLAPAAAGLALPTLVMHGAGSEVVGRSEIARFRALMPSAEVVRIEDAGHLLAMEQFDAFNAALLEFLERRVPRTPIAYEAGSDARTLRDALGCFGTGVVVATALDAQGQSHGLTANSFTSVSLDPPLVLVCIAKSARSAAVFAAAETFAVNVLHIGQQLDSARFAKRAEDRFTASGWETWETGAPILTGSLASIECAKYGWHDGGDHVILVGQVRRARFEPHRDPLLYFRGAYRRLHFL
jgi:flavin reductase (DIM6/NTAB) family NADH-FMN oxidoreductase RutF/pimeloyl-ACP methyl ester carboxylesterase